VKLTRREMIATTLLSPAAFAQSGGSQLPLRASGIEHVGYTAPDPKKSATFFGRIFDPQIFQEMAPPLRYYCRAQCSGTEHWAVEMNVHQRVHRRIPDGHASDLTGGSLE
jgi:hypothetical protein